MIRAATLLSLALLAAPAAGQQAGRVRAGGTEFFRFNLFLHGITPITEPNDALTHPAETMIVIMGDVSRLGPWFNGINLARYLRNGGSILVASSGPAPADWENQFGFRITGRTLTADRDHCYKGHEGRPLLKPRLRVQVEVPSPFDLFNAVDDVGPNAVVADRPSEMALTGFNPGRLLRRELAEYPAATWRRDGQPFRADYNHAVVSFQPQPPMGNPFGRMIVVANQGVFTNGIIEAGFVKDDNAEKGYRFDNGNWAFSSRTIEWLQGGQAKRTRCLFVENGTVVDRFATELPNTTPPIPEIPPDVLANWLLNSANNIIAEKQKQDVFNQFLEKSLGMPRIARAFLVMATLLFLVAALRWLRRGQRKAEPAAVLTPYTQATLLPRGGVLRQRTAAQIEVGNLYEAARRRVRERFDVLGGRPGDTGQMPPVLTANDLPDGPVLHHSVRWLWTLGYGETPIAIPPADWDRTNVLLERVTARAARGDWSFGVEA